MIVSVQTLEITEGRVVTAGSYPRTPQTTPTRHKERAGYDRAAVHAVIDEALVCHVGFVVDGRPLVLPQLHARVGEHLYLHGSSGARASRAARQEGLPVCVTITLIDGLVLARSAFAHSVNYRSVVVHGAAHEVTDPAEKEHALACLVDAVAPGRSSHVRGPSRKELLATTVLRVPLERVSLKARGGPPKDDDSDLGLPSWAGVLPLTGLIPGVPQPAPGLDPDLPVPAHVAQWPEHRAG
jgi:nitroimidazol reductase NimA-like FMN-containing flavoprotein (pyridoxamine 5'-phosphate oxidase superfamily)